MEPPESLQEGGQSLWRAYHFDGMPEAQMVLLTEACRTRDRLDKLDRYLTGHDEWFDIVARYEGDTPQIIVDNALAEVRQQQNSLRQLLATLPVETGTPRQKGTVLDELANRRAGAKPAARKARATRAK